MAQTGKVLARLSRRTFWILLVKVSLLTVAIAAGATISVTSLNYQSELGSVQQVASNLIAIDKGFTLATSTISSAGTSCTTPVIFSPIPGIASTGIASGHLFYDVQVNSTTGAQVSQKFNVTLVLASTTYGPLCIQTPSSPQNGQTIDCKYDVGTTLPTAPYTFKVTVQ